jgi:hypothetical protein
MKRIKSLTIVAALSSLAACSDPTEVRARLEVTADTLTAYAMTGTSPVLPSALNVPFSVTVRADGGVNNGLSYDVAFDIDQTGNAVLYPIRLVVNPLTGSHRVGLLKSTESFDALKRAPTVVFPDTLPLTVAVNEVAIVENSHNAGGDVCQFQVSPNLYAKVVIDSINTTQRTIHFRMVSNPNCGFRSLELGFPTN